MEFTPIQQSQASPSRPDAHSASTPLTVTGSNGQTLAHLKEVTFAVQGGGDSFQQCMELNISRNKPFIPVVPRNEQTRQELEQSKNTMVANYTQAKVSFDQRVAILNLMVDPNEQEQKDLDTAIDVADKAGKILAAARATEILSPNRKLSELPENAVVNLPGHGNANSPRVSTTRERPGQTRTLHEVASDLKQGGLRDDSRVKMRSCHSADTVARSEFIQAPKQPPRTATGMFGVDAMAPAQRLANELKSVGVATPRVTGYQGQGRQNGRLVDGHNQQIINENGEVRHQERSSSVKREFDPYTPNVEAFWNFVGQ